MKKPNKPKQKKLTKPRLDDKIFNTIRHHKLVSILLFVLIFSLSASAHTKYKDWDNAQALRGLNRDFPVLIEQIEHATGLDLDVETNCSTTQEKFGGGVSICQYITTTNYNTSNSAVNQMINTLESSDTFVKDRKFMNKEGYIYKYRKTSACEFAYTNKVHLSCQMGVLDANKGIKY